ncbi:MAG: hypothetical protein J5778_04620 [Clostridiales bacterium]|nr:hypothetical protein [Clostridiales bacterium]
MRYDEKLNYNYVFSKDQTVGGVPGPYVSEYEAQKEELIREGVRPAPHYVAKNIGKLIAVIAPCAVLVFILLGVNSIVSRFFGTSILFHVAVAIGAIAAGIVMSPGFSDLNSKFSFMIDKTKRLVSSLMCFVLAALSIILIFVLPMGDSEKSYFVAGCAFAIAALVNLVAVLMSATEGSRIYSETVESARCIGYVRVIDRSKNGQGKHSISCYHSPVFEYQAMGQRIEAFYDSLIMGSDAYIAIDSLETIHINPKDPGMVQAPVKRKITANIVLMIVFAAIAAFLIYGVLTGGVDGTSISIG